MSQILESLKIDGAIFGQGVSSRSPVKVATTSPGVISTAFIAGNVIDGVTLVLGDRILIKNQASGIENGIYIVTSGTPTRSIDCDLGSSFSGIVIVVTNGTINSASSWICTNSYSSGVVGTDALTIGNYTKFSDASALQTTGASVNVSLSAPPSTGNLLTATSATTASWQAPTAVTGGSFVDASTFIVGNLDVTKRLAFNDGPATSGVTLTLTNNQTTSQVLNYPNITTSDTLVTTSLAQTLTNKTFTLPVISSISNTGILTLPTTSITLVGKATSDIFTNKTITGATNVVDANALKTSGSSVTVSTAAPPISGQALVATSATTAAWSVPVITSGSFIDNVTFIVGNVDPTKRIAFNDGPATSGTTLTLTNNQSTSQILNLPNITTSDTLVTTSLAQTLTNKTLTLPVISSISNTGTLTLPTSTDTLVGKNTTDILTNKTITSSTNVVDANALKTSGVSVTVSTAAPPTTGQALVATSATTAAWSIPVITSGNFIDNVTFIVGNLDPTKRIGFNDGPATSGVTLTLTNNQTTSQILNFPNITATDTLVTTSLAQTLTNKTLTLPIISQISNTGTLTLPTSTDTLVGKNTTDVFTNKTITSSTNTVDANALKTTGTSVNVSSAAPPTTGQILMATAATTATWQANNAVGGNLIDGNTFIVGSVTASKRLGFEVDGNTAAVTLILSTAQTTNQTLNIPNITATDTLVTTSLAQTITNKNLVDSSTFIIGSVTASKILNFEVDGNTAGVTLTLSSAQTTNQILNIPNITTTDTLVTTSLAQSLTNKTITGATNTVDANALKTSGASVNVSSAAPPSTGQVLTATSATTATWQASSNSYQRVTSVLVAGGVDFVAYGCIFNQSGASGIPTTLATTNNYTSTRCTQFNAPNASLGTAGFYTTPANGWVIGTTSNIGGFAFSARIAIESIPSSTRMFVGMSADTTVLNTAFASASNFIGIGFESASTSNWQVIYGGGNVGLTQVDTGIPYGAAARYVKIDFSIPGGGTTLTYSVTNCDTLAVFSGTFTGVLGTTLPASSTALGMFSLMRTLVIGKTIARLADISVTVTNQ